MKRTGYKISLISLLLALVIALAAFIGLQLNFASAAGTVTVSGGNVFTATGDANVIAHREQKESAPSEGEGEYAYYTMFAFAYNKDTVAYRKNLAYKWQEDKDTVGYFNMTVGFENTSFKRFVIKFESQHYVKNKDGKAVNYVIFFPATAGKVKALITTDGDATETESTTELDASKITIKFTGRTSDKYAVEVADATASVTGEFENVAGTYAKASTSSSSPVYPLVFNAEFADEEQEGRESAKMVLYSLNGQSFELSGTSYNQNLDYYYGGTVTDETAPVLCLEDELMYFKLGGEIDFDYAVIDVLRTSPKATVKYYPLSKGDAKNTEFDSTKEDNFTEIKSSDKYILKPAKDDYLPAKEGKFDYDTTELRADMAVKVLVTLQDTTSNPATKNVYLDWYVPAGYKVTPENGADFIAVAEDTRGASYNYDGISLADGGMKAWGDVKTAGTILGDYQAKIDELTKDLSAGSLTNLYLPSVEELFSDNATAYTDLKFSIYYYGASQLSNTGLSYNNLYINVTQKGPYTFTIYATDAAGNDMYYIDDKGELVEFSAGDIWDMYADKDEEGLTAKLPWFTFTAGYTGVKFDEVPGLQSTAYVGTSYNSASSSFKINGISGSYTTEYRLFLFDRAGYYAYTNGETLTYETFVEKLDELFDNPETAKFFAEIPSVSDMEETDPDYDKYEAYGWSKTSTTFTPQDNNAFYLIRAEVKDNNYNTDPSACNLGVSASVKAKTIKGESDWIKNNIASVVLLTVAGIALVGIILLLVIKPKNKEDIDVTFEKAEKSKKKGK
ncbi:MAG: hypothetical protein K2K60_01515 [Clostridia bacterium]|nr:hypothetical protein [Clostridia bacterium]